MALNASELILNADQSIYHLNLLPQDLAHTIITVGDPDRVKEVSDHFDTIELKKGKREFITHTGTRNGKRISVISTGIGTDNIDIVLNELDALANIDFSSRTIKAKHTQLDIIRIGTSGAIQSDIPIDSFLLSEYAVGLDGLLHYYSNSDIQHRDFQEAFVQHTNWATEKSTPYVVSYDSKLAKMIISNRIRLGVTITSTGFYGPQGRQLRLVAKHNEFLSNLQTFQHSHLQITNLEMETSGIYALSKLLGHRAISLNAILANRITGAFSRTPKKTVDELIQYTLERLTGG
ncbi:nucleoside phosphorylase [uncultured Kriegella sp.]|uniref:nucleoside phosphorylase n=1 Tax=uncultured Kriegella sp. TaxID=1798910 RepID=UPI0030D7454B|tara:strand:- start:113102 stop:113974 length:873 start_codon:yes stop_codon:yes gene_type:complete